MSTSLYDLSVASYLQQVGAVAGFLEQGRAWFAEQGKDPDTIVDARLAPDMLPFSFQVHCVAHHSLGALEGLRSGEFGPPRDLAELDYAGFQALIKDTLAQLEQTSREEVDALDGGDVVFRLSGMEMPFTCSNFVLSFSLPNLHFHATTAYDLLRLQGASLGKRDYLGVPRLKA